MKSFILLLFLIGDAVTSWAQANTNRVYNFGATQKPLSKPIGNYRSLTIDHTKVPNTDQTNFPVLFSGTFTYLRTTANGGKVANPSGFDILLSTDSLNNSPVPWQIESWNPVTGAIVLWVKLPTVSSSVDQVFYLHYNNAAITTFQGSNAGSVWDANFTGVWHMADVLTGSGQTIADGTTNAFNMTSSGSWISGQQAAGKVGGSLSFLNASSDFASFSNTTFGGAYTFEGWYNLSIADPTSVGFGNAAIATFGPNINWYGGAARLFSGTADMVVDGTATSTSTWTHIVFTRTGTSLIAYHNGTNTGTSANGATIAFQWLAKQAGSLSADIKFDELRISTVARGPDWIATEYANMNSPSTFITVGSEF